MAFDPEKINRSDTSPVWEVGHGTRAAAAPAAGEAQVDNADQELRHEDELMAMEQGEDPEAVVRKFGVTEMENGDEV